MAQQQKASASAATGGKLVRFGQTGMTSVAGSGCPPDRLPKAPATTRGAPWPALTKTPAQTTAPPTGSNPRGGK